MKKQSYRTNAQKARQLHKECKSEIVSLLVYIQQTHEKLCKNQEELRRFWDQGFLSFDTWLELGKQSNDIITANFAQMVANGSVFSNKLTYNYTVVFNNHCILQYAQRVGTSEKFKAAVAKLYNS